jgi:hypothetical protein
MLARDGDSHFRPYLASLGINFDLEDMLAKRDRQYQIALDPVKGEQAQTCLPPMQSDLAWVGWTMAVSFAGGWLLGRFTRRRS